MAASPSTFNPPASSGRRDASAMPYRASAVSPTRALASPPKTRPAGRTTGMEPVRCSTVAKKRCRSTIGAPRFVLACEVIQYAVSPIVDAPSMSASRFGRPPDPSVADSGTFATGTLPVSDW